MILTFLLKHNLIPYIAIVVLATAVYWQHSAGIKKDILIAEQAATQVLTFESMNIIQTGNEKRLQELERVKTVWKAGKHEDVL